MKFLVFTCMLLAGVVAAQTPTFEIAAIKAYPPDAPCAESMIVPMSGGGLHMKCVPLKLILTWTYEIQDYQISGGPSWVDSVRWDILAKTDASEAKSASPINFEKMTDAQRKQSVNLIRQRLKALLADRFQLALRRETKEQSVYTLTVAKNGPKLKESADQSAPGVLRRGRNQIISSGTQMERLAQFLAIDLHRPVLDRTGLTGYYDFKLEWTPDRPDSGGDGTSSPTIFTAIQEQLGLRLGSEKGPVGVLVIERVEKATEN